MKYDFAPLWAVMKEKIHNPHDHHLLRPDACMKSHIDALYYHLHPSIGGTLVLCVIMCGNKVKSSSRVGICTI